MGRGKQKRRGRTLLAGLPRRRVIHDTFPHAVGKQRAESLCQMRYRLKSLGDSIQGFERDIANLGLSDTGFVLDGYHHGLLVLSRWPKVSFPGIIHRLTNLPLLDYTITVNVDPLSARKEITREEKAHDRSQTECYFDYTVISGDDVRELAERCAEGSYGRLFDGASNVSLTGKIAHFELGYIPESAKAFCTAAGFLITNYTRQHIITLPRSVRKRNIYEEVARKRAMRSFASSTAGTSRSCSNTPGSKKAASARRCSATVGNSFSCGKTTVPTSMTSVLASACPT